MQYVIYFLAAISILLSIGGFTYQGPKKIWVVLASIISITFSSLAIALLSLWPLVIGFALNWLLRLFGLEPSNSEILSGLESDEDN